MWLLSTDRAELLNFAKPPEVYAILSHVWRKAEERPKTEEQPKVEEPQAEERHKAEQSFQQLTTIIHKCKAAGWNPRDHADDKVKKCCLWAEAHGFKLLWIDSCCIDKSSSAELSEAINSMYTWYAQATICYAYLPDVPHNENPAALNSKFRTSEWFSRGWTLQELIAPRDVIFLSGNWQPLTSKINAARLLEEITGIDADVLRGRRPLSEVNVARRMSWAAKRNTTRLEDQAYCLMGIFGVNMPTIYGEGVEAFIRLQEEIIKRTPDRTLLAWGPRHDLKEIVVGYRSSVFPTPKGERYIQESCLLAQSPREFADENSITSVSSETLAEAFKISTERYPFAVSSYGAHMLFPIVHFQNHCTLALLPCKKGDAFLALVLRFQAEHGPWSVGTRALVTQTLHTSSHQSGTRAETISEEHAVRCVLVCNLEDLASCMQHPLRRSETVSGPTPAWKSIFVAYRYQHVLVHSPDEGPKLWTRRSYVAPCKLIIPVWALGELKDEGYRLVHSLPSAFFDLDQGQMFSLVFTTAFTPDRWSAFSVHIGSQGPQDYSRPTRNPNGKPSAAPLWCTVRFPDVHGRLEFQQAEEWLARELLASPPTTSSQGNDLLGGDVALWHDIWSRSYVDAWANGRRDFNGPALRGSQLRLRFERLCDLPAQKALVAQHGVQDIYLLQLALGRHGTGQRALSPSRTSEGRNSFIPVPARDSENSSSTQPPFIDENSRHHTLWLGATTA